MKENSPLGRTLWSRSFSARISIWVTIGSALIFLAAFGLCLHFARQQVKEEALRSAQSALENALLQIDGELSAVETAVQNTARFVPDFLGRPEELYTLCRRLLEANPRIYGTTVAFEPGYYPQLGKHFAPYVYRTPGADSLACRQLGTKDYEYHYMGWYQIPQLLGRSYWSEPYYDKGGGEMMMATYSLPLHDAQGRMYAVLTADVSLQQITSLMERVKPYPQAYSFILSRSGTYLAHPRQERLLNQTAFTIAFEQNDSAISRIGYRMVDGEQGIGLFDEEGTKNCALFAPIRRTGWSAAIVCPYDNLFAGVEKTRNTMITVSLIGLLLMLLTCMRTISRLSAPLRKFADAALQIAKGDFRTPLPQPKYPDEMGQLKESLDYMQHSLAHYTEELKDTTQKKERIESELRIANEIQMSMIPKIFPPYPEREDIDLFAMLLPAKLVGGDLYDFFISEEEKLYFLIGDVSGKGIPASLVMAVTRSLFRNTAAHLKKPKAIVESLNASLAEGNETNMFVTLFIGILDLKSGNLAFCNAGHNPPVLCRPGEEARYMQVLPNLPTGLMEGWQYEAQETCLPPGTMLYFYTDGVSESENKAKELYSEERLLRDLEQLKGETPQAVVETVAARLRGHAAGAEQNDDITMLCIRYKR